MFLWPVSNVAAPWQVVWKGSQYKKLKETFQGLYGDEKLDSEEEDLFSFTSNGDGDDNDADAAEPPTPVDSGILADTAETAA